MRVAQPGAAVLHQGGVQGEAGQRAAADDMRRMTAALDAELTDKQAAIEQGGSVTQLTDKPPSRWVRHPADRQAAIKVGPSPS